MAQTLLDNVLRDSGREHRHARNAWQTSLVNRTLSLPARHRLNTVGRPYSGGSEQPIAGNLYPFKPVCVWGGSYALQEGRKVAESWYETTEAWA